MHCKGLCQLKLDNCQLSNHCVAEIAKNLPCCRALSHISMRYNLIGDDGARALSCSLPLCTSLAYLDLSSNIIYDSGCKALISMVPHCPALTDLRFGGNGIGRGVCLKLQDALELRKAVTAEAVDIGCCQSAADGST
jgi:Ran GTPase-activating protein (RanGAP) involved in mRNA processing and transport